MNYRGPNTKPKAFSYIHIVTLSDAVEVTYIAATMAKAREMHCLRYPPPSAYKVRRNKSIDASRLPIGAVIKQAVNLDDGYWI